MLEKPLTIEEESEALVRGENILAGNTAAPLDICIFVARVPLALARLNDAWFEHEVSPKRKSNNMHGHPEYSGLSKRGAKSLGRFGEATEIRSAVGPQ